MTELSIDNSSCGVRIDRFIMSTFEGIGAGKLNKLLRKRYITVNRKKVGCDYRLEEGDVVRIFFDVREKESVPTDGYLRAYEALKDRIGVVYETGDIIIADKAAGVLSQKAEGGDISLNEWITGYMLVKGQADENTFKGFHPSVCNRLDRNTSGLVICAKTQRGAREMNGLIRDRRIGKYYLALVHGEVRPEGRLAGMLIKDPVTNTVNYRALPEEDESKTAQPEGVVSLLYRRVFFSEGISLVEIKLETGKPHQIRAQLQALGHPILFDPKYGDRVKDAKVRSRTGLSCRRQLLHCARLEFDDDVQLEGFKGHIVNSCPPEDMESIIDCVEDKRIKGFGS